MIVRVTVTVEALGYRWTVDSDLVDLTIDELGSHGWLRGSNVVSVVNEDGIGFPKHAWEALLSDPMRKAELQTTVERSIREGFAHYGRA